MTSKNTLTAALTCVVALTQSVSYADLTATDILNILVEENILSQEKAKALVEKARERANRETQQQGQDSQQQQQQQPADSTIRVPYVPEFVKDEIKNSVKQEVVTELQDSVVEQAKEQGWGIESAPEWVNRVTLSGDVRFRYQGDFFPSDNPNLAFFNINRINSAGGVDQAGRDAFTNTVDDRHRLRVRARLNIKADLGNGVDVGMRLLTGNQGSPVSANQTLGSFSQKWDSSFDLAYINYESQSKGWRLVGGRFKNPWLHTDLVWDGDMTFEGLASSYYPLRSSGKTKPAWDPYLTLGVFPLQEINKTEFASDDFAPPNDDKWLYAVQFGNTVRLTRNSTAQLAAAYYFFDNVVGLDNGIDQNSNDTTASPFYQFGNTLQNIVVADDAGSPQRELYALASEFELVNVTFKYDYAGLHKYKVGFHADWVLNQGFNADEVVERIGGRNLEVPDRDTGYQIGFAFGTKSFAHRGDWKASFKYRYLEGDAVIDAFADSNFLLGGTNAKGYVLRGDVMLVDDVFMSLRWLSAEEIDIPNVGEAIGLGSVEVDTFQLDINTRF